MLSLVFFIVSAYSANVSVIIHPIFSTVGNVTTMNSFAAVKDWQAITCLQIVDNITFVTLANPADAYYDMVYIANRRLPDTLAAFHWFIVHFVGFGMPIIVILYITYCRLMVCYRTRDSGQLVLGGIEGQMFFLTMSATYISFVCSVGLPMMAASTDSTVPWVMFCLSIVFSLISILAVLRMFGLKVCKIQGWVGYGRTRQQIVAQQMEDNLAREVELGNLTVDTHGTVRRDGQVEHRVHNVELGAGDQEIETCLVLLTDGTSQISALRGTPWKRVHDGSAFLSTEIRLLAKHGLVWQDNNGNVAAKDVNHVRYKHKNSYSCASYDDMESMLWQLLRDNKCISKIIAM